MPVKPATWTPKDAAFNKLTFLFYGPPGAGKTFLMGTASYDPKRFGRLLFLCPDPGTLTLTSDERMENIEIAGVTGTKDVDAWYEYLKGGQKDLAPEDRIRTICFDGLTDYARIALQEFLEQTSKENSTRDINMPAKDHYNRLKTLMYRDIARLRDIKGVHFIASALEKRQQDEKTGVVFITPDIGTGAMSQGVPGLFDIVGYYNTMTNAQGKLTRQMRFINDARILVKDRSRTLPETLDNPDLPGVLTQIETNEPTAKEQGAVAFINRPKSK